MQLSATILLHFMLLSSISLFPAQHQEFSFLLKERVCPLVIKLFSPNIKFRQGSSSATSPAPVEKPYFPICMRLLRVVSVLIKHFYSLLVREWSAVMVDWPELAPERWKRGISSQMQLIDPV